MQLDLIDKFSFHDIGLGRNIIIFVVDMSSSIKIDNRKNIYFNSWKRSNAGFRTHNKC